MDDGVSITVLLIFLVALSNMYQSPISTINWSYRTHTAKRNIAGIACWWFDNDGDIVDDDVTYHADTIVAIFHLILKKGQGHGSYSIIYDLCDHKWQNFDYRMPIWTPNPPLYKLGTGNAYILAKFTNVTSSLTYICNSMTVTKLFFSFAPRFSSVVSFLYYKSHLCC